MAHVLQCMDTLVSKHTAAGYSYCTVMQPSASQAMVRVRRRLARAAADPSGVEVVPMLFGDSMVNLPVLVTLVRQAAGSE